MPTLPRQISVIVPALNEEANIEPLLKRLDASLRGTHIDYEVIVIDDNSTDNTIAKCESLRSRFPISVHRKQGQKGKAQALIEGFGHAQYKLSAMIDADLQYPPEALPVMVEKILRDEADIMVAERAQYEDGFIRKFTSRVFNLVFAKLLHGLYCDVQSGLKVFKTQITREVSVFPSPWTFDMEFLLKARSCGYRIECEKIVFAERTEGQSKINVIKASFEIGWSAIKLKFKKFPPINILPEPGKGMIGAGVMHNGKRFITHTTLSHDISSIITFMPWQKAFLATAVIALGVGLYLSPVVAISVFMGVLSAIYFFDAAFNLHLVSKSLHTPPEISFTKKQLLAINDEELPMYTVLCPLFRESQVLPGFVDAIEKVDWPKHKLDVMLLLEENDQETIDVARNMKLPDYVRIIVVPHSLPKTKPKACNYGLSLAKGEYLVVYDAEDVPEKFQLKKAYLAFKTLPPHVKCLQAKLNYFNPNQNLLTRLFTAEYSLWFNIVLPGLQSINTSIPLGGTSNHFRTADLQDLKGWDPFNVTEDADLGTRLFTMGAQTAIIDSTTLEEANSNLRNWIRQRSRWIKGYMQTYLVHMRRPFAFWRKSGRHFFVFQLNVGGKIAFMLINPILWLATISYFALNSIVGPAIESVYPTPVLYMAAASLVFGNFLYFYYYMIGCAKQGHWSLIKFIFLVPFYWFFMSVAAVMALYELIVRPHYWQKTNHGLHLAKKPVAAPVAAPVVAPVTAVPVAATPRPALASESSLMSRGSVLIAAMMVSNVLNFLFNAFIGRKLSLEDLGLVTLINTLWYVASIFIGGISSTVNHRTAFLSAKDGAQASISFWRVTLRLAITGALIASVVWIIAIPFLSDFFRIEDKMLLLLFTPVLTLGVIAAANRGFLQGSLMFQATAAIFVTESITKFLAAGVLVYFGLNGWVFVAIPFSILASAAAAWVMSRNLTKKLAGIPGKVQPYEFPKFFYAASIISSISAAVFLSLDIILVKHYLTPAGAGEYALLALVGKMIYFLGSLPAVFMLTFVSRAEGLGKKTESTLYAILGITLAMVSIGFVALGIYGKELVPLLLGEKTLSILPYLQAYTLAIALFTLANVIVSYHLAKKQYLFPAASLAVSVLMAVGITLSHDSIGSIVAVMSGASVFALGLMGVLHFFKEYLQYVANNVIDFFDAFIRRPVARTAVQGQRILIFNWRDTKHTFAGGAEVYIHEMAKRMVTKGDAVTLFCGNDGKSPRNEVVDGVNVVRRGGFYMVYFWAFLYYFTQFRGQYDVIIDGHNGIPFFTPLYVRKPIICIVHHIHQEVFRRSLPFGLAQFACFLERDVMPLVYKNIEFVTVSPSSKKEMVEYGLIGKGIQIVHNGVDLTSFRPAAKSELPMVLYLGRLKAYKSIDVLITAFKLALEKAPEAFLVIAGSGEEDKHLKRLVKQLNLEEKVTFTGRISEKEKISLLQKAWVMVNPSFMEGWGITTIEANACGTPVIGADVAGLRDSIKDFETGYLVPHGDTQNFARVILKAIEDRKGRAQMSQKSLEWAQNFSWERSVRQLSSIVAGR